MAARSCAGRRAGQRYLGCRGNAVKCIVPKAARDEDQVQKAPYTNIKSTPKAVSDPSTDGATTLPLAVSPTLTVWHVSGCIVCLW